MEFFRFKRDVNFMKSALIFNVISMLTFVLAVFFLWTKGLHLSIEFTGGTLVEVRTTQAADLERVRGAMSGIGYGDAQVQNFGASDKVLIRVPVKKEVDAQTQTQQVMVALQTIDNKVVLERNEFVGPQIGDELATNGLLALLFVSIGIVVYLAFRFEWKFAVAGILANLHDVVIILGFFAFFQWEFSLSVLAAVLAILGYSVNESVVIFDRIREVFRDNRSKNLSVAQVMNHAITSTMSRTIITHGMTEMMVIAMLLFGGPTLHYFALALTIGIVFGIYSSVFVAAAIAMWLGVSRKDLELSAEAIERQTADRRDPNFGAQV